MWFKALLALVPIAVVALTVTTAQAAPKFGAMPKPPAPKGLVAPTPTPVPYTIRWRVKDKVTATYVTHKVTVKVIE